MRYCPITYQLIKTEAPYSKAGLKSLSPVLKQLQPLAYTAQELREKAHTQGLHLPGTQPKLGAQLKIKESRFELVENESRYIIKLPSERLENEALTMSLAAAAGIDVPVHGLLYLKDKNKAYFIKRFDRIGHNQKMRVEDFAQLSQQSSHTAYQSSMEKVAGLLMQFTSFPKVEALKLFKLVLFNFLVGNADMHLKRFALVAKGEMITLAPGYGLYNSNLTSKKITDEIALPLNHKKMQLNQTDFLDYFAKTVLGLNEATIRQCVKTIQASFPIWQTLVRNSFLSPPMKMQYMQVLKGRGTRLGLL